MAAKVCVVGASGEQRVRRLRVFVGNEELSTLLATEASHSQPRPCFDRATLIPLQANCLCYTCWVNDRRTHPPDEQLD